MNMFRLLNANEIDCRISQISAEKDGTPKGLSLLLYKDARCDMNILDETVGVFNWKREHSRENANCTVSIWDKEKQEWISKEDTGTESNTEAQKGLASDSFKRACFNWGIGRELYSSPFIWIPADKCSIYERGTDSRTGKKQFGCNDKFVVEKIAYNKDTQEISGLSIVNGRTRKRVFVWQAGENVIEPEPQEKTPDTPSESRVNPDMIMPTCCNCGKSITDAEKKYSLNKFKMPLCRDCQKKQ